MYVISTMVTNDDGYWAQLDQLSGVERPARPVGRRALETLFVHRKRKRQYCTEQWVNNRFWSSHFGFVVFAMTSETRTDFVQGSMSWTPFTTTTFGQLQIFVQERSSFPLWQQRGARAPLLYLKKTIRPRRTWKSPFLDCLSLKFSNTK